MIDLHTHTAASDGTDTPAQLIDRAVALGLEALAITDHDTFRGSDEAVPLAAAKGLRFVRGLELSTRQPDEPNPASRSVHVLGYFFGEPAPAFREWLETLRAARRERNRAMAEKLTALGIPVTVEEAEAHGRNITGRPHFARVMRDKGFISSIEEAFQRYLGETGIAYVERQDPSTEDGIRRIVEAGGLASLAHPFRLNKTDPIEEEALIRRFAGAGLGAVEVWHSDHDQSTRDRYIHLARKYGLGMSGGSDYHGDNKPHVLLGRGRNGVNRVPLALLDDLCRRAAHH
ncbi:PHP domain-containing protein [uncultured Paludibaculum sp.]|uniref:PHP domain-containing protein n=1 Tax=uncultured Paludibaculum sp. TaxID=1765020 RepID=UPI002AAB6C85|nr:PHP domain-containing protein [uncultured Paludibaculum sp.]